MWPFTIAGKPGINTRRLDDTFSTTGQVSAEQMEAIKAAGFRSILCARPDREEPGQPDYATIAVAARAAGLATAHIPVSGMLTEGNLIRMQQALADLPGPILGYCRSGARAGSLYAALAGK